MTTVPTSSRPSMPGFRRGRTRGEGQRRHQRRAVENTYWPMAVRTPISATRSARSPNSATSRAGRPNSFTRVAPGAEKRSVIWVVMAELWSAASRSRCGQPAPMRRAGMTKTGSRTSASSVICHDRREHHDQGEQRGRSGC